MPGIIGIIVLLSTALDFGQTHGSSTGHRPSFAPNRPHRDRSARRGGGRISRRGWCRETCFGSRPAIWFRPTTPPPGGPDLYVQQAALTGESLPAEKEATKRLARPGRCPQPGLPRHVGGQRHGGRGGRGDGSPDCLWRHRGPPDGRPAETEFDRGSRGFGSDPRENGLPVYPSCSGQYFSPPRPVSIATLCGRAGRRADPGVPSDDHGGDAG